jgi:hypothetical protein
MIKVETVVLAHRDFPYAKNKVIVTGTVMSTVHLDRFQFRRVRKTFLGLSRPSVFIEMLHSLTRQPAVLGDR